MSRREFLKQVRVEVAASGVSREEAALTVAARMLNEYALENIVLGKAIPCESVSFEDYVLCLGINCNTYMLRLKLCREHEYINAGGRIAAVSVEECRRKFFDKKFSDIGVDVYRDNSDELYEIFEKVAKVPLCHEDEEYFALSLYERERVRKFLTAIRKRSIKEGSAVMRFFSNICMYPFERVLLSPITHRLQVDDINALEYKLTALMLFDFVGDENEEIFVSKLMKFYNSVRG